MINEETIFILGAGASDHYKYPMGSELVEMIFTAILKDQNTFNQDLSACNIQPHRLRLFAQQLRDSNASSIDEFLEHSSEEFEQIGKLAIARALIPLEINDNLRGGWYQYLLRAMNSSLDYFPNNRVAFITFNYDRSLEQFFVSSIANKYGVDTTVAAEKFKMIPVIHVHGALSPLYRFRQSDPDARPYSTQLHPTFLQIAAGNIRVIHGGASAYDPFNEAVNLLKTDIKKTVCFLGFGFHSLNIERLKMKTWRNVTKIYYSRFGITDRELDRMKAFLPSSLVTDQHHIFQEFGQRNHKCEEFLKEIGIITPN